MRAIGRFTQHDRERRLIKRLRAWIHREVRDAVDAELRRVRVRSDDPLRTFQENAEDLGMQLTSAANRVGRNVMVGRDVIMWGGKFPGGRGLELHDDVRIYDHCRLVIDQLGPDSGIVLESKVAMNFGCYLEGAGGIRIGQRTILGPHVVIVSSGHRIDPELPIQESGKRFASVEIAEDVWIGANAVVRMGVRIGARAVVGAGAIVTSDVAPDTVVAGNPARVIRATAEKHDTNATR